MDHESAIKYYYYYMCSLDFNLFKFKLVLEICKLLCLQREYLDSLQFFVLEGLVECGDSLRLLLLQNDQQVSQHYQYLLIWL